MNKNPILFFKNGDDEALSYATSLQSIYSEIVVKPLNMHDKVQLVDINNKLHQGYAAVNYIYPTTRLDSGKLSYGKRPKIIILWATIRPEVFKATHTHWMNTASNKNNIITLVAVDTQEQADKLTDYDVMITNNTTPGVCYPCYCLSSSFTADPNDIIIYASDDFFPPKNWDIFLYSQFANETKKVLVVNDGIQKYPSNVVTLPIMTYGALESLNYTIYHPAYTHMFTDNELYDIAKRMDMLKDIRPSIATVFEHRHYDNNKRKADDHDIKLAATYNEGNRIYNSRKGKPIKELLKVSDDIIEKLKTIPNYAIKDLTTKSKKLSILICTLPSRKHFLDRLMEKLNTQLTPDIEILVESDDGSMKIGKKRNILLSKAIGDYVCFVDDDDLVSDDYAQKILNAIKTNPDCCSLEGLYTVNGQNPTLFRHSLKYTKWETANENGKTVYYRCPNHLNVIKRDIALKVKFNDNLSNGEDRDFSERIRPLLKTESNINGVIYHYLYLQVKKGY